MPHAFEGDRLGDSCRRTLVGWRSPTPAQEDLRLLYLDHLDRVHDGWSRSVRGAHLTASALICVPKQEQVLLTLHAKIGRWLQTGGHLEQDDHDVQAAALRESAEESGLSGLTVDPVPLLLSRHEVSCDGEPAFHLDVQFLVTAPAVLEPVFGPESLDVRWFPVSTLPDCDQSVLALVAAATRRLSSATQVTD